MKVRRFGRGRSFAFDRSFTMLRRARLAFTNPQCPPREQLKVGINALRFCEYFSVFEFGNFFSNSNNSFLGSFETPSLPFPRGENSFYEHMSSLNCWAVTDTIGKMWSGKFH